MLQPEPARTPPDKNASTPAERRCQTPVGALIQGAEGLVFDLDYTLVDSANGFQTLNRTIATRLGVRNYEPVNVMDRSMRGQPPDAYLRAFFVVCARHGNQPDLRYEDFLALREETMTNMSTGAIQIEGGVQPVPGALEIVRVIAQTWKKKIKICTHCPRKLAKAFLLQGGFDGLVPDHSLHCGDDTILGKHQPEYWRAVLRETEANRWVGFDDTPHGAQWMLETASIGTVIVRPSADKYRSELVSLKARFSDRLVVVQTFEELFAPEIK